MIAILKHGTTPAQREQLIAWLKRLHVDVHISEGAEDTVLGLIGDTSRVDMDLLASLDIVRSVKRVSEPYKQANRKFHPRDTVIEIGSAKIGGGHFAMIAGPCSVESEEQVLGIAKAVKAAGATMLRGGAFKPRTSPYDFQGLKGDGIELLLEAKEESHSLKSELEKELKERKELYEKAKELCGNANKVAEHIMQDKEALIARGVSETELQLLIDLIS